METITFSKRLYGTAGILIYLAFSFAFIAPIASNVAHDLPAMILIVGLILLFTLAATVGWRWCMRQRSARVIYLYFAGQTSLFFIIFLVENIASRQGAASGNLTTVLLLQVCVLTWRWRIALYLGLVGGMAAVSALLLPIEGVWFPAVMSLVIFGTIMLFGHLIVSEEQARQQLGESNQRLAEYAAQVEELATVSERNRLAREIHDNLGHYLTAVNMQIEAALAVMQSDPARAHQSMTKAQSLTKDGLAEIRRSVAALRADPIENRPLHEAIMQLIEEHRATGLDVTYRVDGAIRPCSAQVEMTLYRAAQEGLTNIRKHAQATRADLQLSYQHPGAVSLKLRDNGIGSASDNSGFGLLGIRERVKLLGGQVNIQTSQGQGFQLCVELPA